MKLIALFCLIGFAAASQQHQGILKPGQSYTFQYEGRMLTGMPRLAPHYSGLNLTSTVHVEYSQQNGLGGEYRIQVQDVKFVKVNHELQAEGTDVSRNWRNIYINSFGSGMPVPADMMSHLAKPAVLMMTKEGKFESLEVSKDEPEWSVNFKKALAVLFSTQTYEQQTALIENMLEEQSMMSDESVTYWKTEEESLEGLCEVTYQVNELPEYIIRENSYIIPYNKTCQGSGVKYYEIVRSRDVNTCQRRGVYSFYKAGHMRCHLGNCESQITRSSVSRYVACGTGRDDLHVQTVSNEGEMEVDLLGSNTERFVSGNRQNLTLVEVRSGSMGIQKPSNPIKKTSMTFEVKQEMSRLPSVVSKLGGNLPEGIEALKVNMAQGSDINPQTLITDMKKIFEDVINTDLEQTQASPDKELPIKMLTLARGFSLLSQKQDIETLYTQLKQEFQSNQEKMHTMKNLFFDTVLLGGTRVNFKFVIEKIESGEIGDLQAVTLFGSMPNLVTIPTEELIQEFYQLVKNLYGTGGNSNRSPFVYQQGLLSLSSLVHKACVSEEREQSYPVGIYGEMCHTQSEIVVQEIIPQIKSWLESAPAIGEGNTCSKDLYLLALGLIGHKNVLPILLPYLQTGTGSSSSSSSSITDEEAKFLRFVAIFSVRNVGMRYPGLTEPMLFSVLGNPSELTELRAAAFRCLISLNPSESYLHRIASLTWRERDEELLKVIDLAFWSLSSRRDFEPLRTSYSSLSRKAYVIYPLLKKVGQGAAYSSGDYYSVDFLPELNDGYFSATGWTFTGRSFYPTDFFHRLTVLFNRYQLTTYEMGYRLVGAETMVQHAVEMLTPGQMHKSVEQYEEMVKNRDISPEFKEIIEKLGLKMSESDKGLLSLYFNFVESTPLFKTLKSTSSSNLKDQIQKIFKADPSKLKDFICGEHKVNYQRVFSVHTGVQMIPNDMGYPIFMETHVPTVLSVRGSLKVDCNSGKFIPKFEVEGKKMWQSAFTGFVGTVIPFTKEIASTGVEQNVAVHFPVKFQVESDSEQQIVKAKFSTYSTSSNDAVDVLYYEGKPYTVIKGLTDLTPFSKHGNFRIIRSSTVRQGKQWNFGQYLGMDLEAGVTSESRFLDFRTIFDKLKLYKNNPLNLIRFATAGTAMSQDLQPSVRYHQYYLKFRPSSSQTKEVEMQLKWGHATKMQDGTVKYNMMKMKMGEELESYPEWKKIIPVKMESPMIDEVSSHPQRRSHLKETMSMMNIRSGSALTMTFWIKLTGQQQQREYDLTVTKVLGEEHNLKQKWHLSAQSSKSQNKFCLDGHLQLPHMPFWKVEELRAANAEFQMENTIGFGGSKCDQTKVIVRGQASVSQEQKEYSRRSEMAKLHKTLMSQGVPMVDMSDVAQKLREQASTLDTYDMTVEYQNVGSKGEFVARYFSEYLKAYLWPNMYFKSQSFSSSGSPMLSGNSYSAKHSWQFKYEAETNTLNIVLNKQNPTETVTFKHIRLPRFVGHFYPATAVGMTKIAQSGLIPYKTFRTCKLEGMWMQTLNNATVMAEMDQCFHVLSADASVKKTFAILERNMSSSRDSTKELKAIFGKTTILMTPKSNSHSAGGSNPGLTIMVNGTEIRINSGDSHEVRDFNMTLIAKIHLSSDMVVSLHGVHCSVMNVMSVIVNFDGFKTELSLSPMYAGKLTGMCGKMNGLRLGGLVGPKGCVYSKPELLTASFRVSTSAGKTCSALPSKIETELKKEESECLMVHETGSGNLLKSFEGQVGPCSRHTHKIVEQVDKYCFSRVPVISCSPACKPTQTVKKSVSFGCLPKGRVAERYSEKIRRGEILEELKGLSEEFSTQLYDVPQSCQEIKN